MCWARAVPEKYWKNVQLRDSGLPWLDEIDLRASRKLFESIPQTEAQIMQPEIGDVQQ
jgi:hypothetical protein